MDDIKRCSSLAYQTVSEFGLSAAVGPLSVASLTNGGSDDAPLFGRDSGDTCSLPCHKWGWRIDQIGTIQRCVLS